jgi:transcriptional regulator with XRE-family HTH domain
MVDKLPHIRVSPSVSPDAFTNFSLWLAAATDRYGMRAELATYCGVTNQHVHNWLHGKVTRDPRLLRLISEWAQVDYVALRDLHDRHQSAPKQRAAIKRRKPSLKRARIASWKLAKIRN